MSSSFILLLNLTSTWAMVGLIWMVQVVHYPLFMKVGPERFSEYCQDHQRLTTYVVMPLMFAELITTVLLWFYRPTGVPTTWIVAGIMLVSLVWASTFLIQVPVHRTLLLGFDAQACRRLVMGNWIRTVAWTLRGWLAASMVWRVMHG